MAYTKVFSGKKFAPLSSILEEIAVLPEGKAFLLEVDGKEREKVRFLLYDWLYHMEIKEKFRVKKVGQGLLVERKSQLVVSGRALGEEAQRIQEVVEEALKSEEPGKVLRSRLEGEALRRAVERLGKLLD